MMLRWQALQTFLFCELLRFIHHEYGRLRKLFERPNTVARSEDYNNVSSTKLHIKSLVMTQDAGRLGLEIKKLVFKRHPNLFTTIASDDLVFNILHCKQFVRIIK